MFATLTQNHTYLGILFFEFLSRHKTFHKHENNDRKENGLEVNVQKTRCIFKSKSSGL